MKDLNLRTFNNEKKTLKDDVRDVLAALGFGGGQRIHPIAKLQPQPANLKERRAFRILGLV